MKMFTEAIQTTIFGALLAFLFGPLLADGKKINSFAGPFTVYADRFYACEGAHNWSWNLHTTYFNPGKPKDIQKITGWVNGTGSSVDDNQYLNVVLDARSNNQWKENAFVFKFPNGACSVLKKQIPEFYHRIFHKDRKDKGCSLRPILYEVEDEPIPWLFPNFPVMPYGEYRFRLKTGDQNKPPTTCFIVECHIIPKAG